MSRSKPATPQADVQFALNMAKARRARGWTCADLERAVREQGTPMPNMGIWKSENQGRTVSFGEAIGICAALGVTFDQMLIADQQFTVAVTMTGLSDVRP